MTINPHPPHPTHIFGGPQVPAPVLSPVGPRHRRIVCTTCNGRGIVAVRVGGHGLVQATCPTCKGSGDVS